MPNAISPPMTPERIRINGKSAPIRISIGRITLSSVPTTPLHTSSTVPQVESPVQYSQIMAGTSTGKGPSCTRQERIITTASSVAYGTPVTARPIPPSTACTSAVTTTPNATARMACAASRMAASPRLDARRQAK